MSAEDMHPDDRPPPEQPDGPLISRKRMPFLTFVRLTLTVDVGRGNRLAVLVSLAGVAWAAGQGFWWTLAGVALWWMFLQAVLLDARMTGFLKGHEDGHIEGHHCVENAVQGLTPLPIEVLVDFCQEHNVPMQAVERLIWGRGDDE